MEAEKSVKFIHRPFLSKSHLQYNDTVSFSRTMH